MQKYQYEHLYKVASSEQGHIHQVTHVDEGIVCTICNGKLVNIMYKLHEDGTITKHVL